jgi:hypothetical protein
MPKSENKTPKKPVINPKKAVFAPKTAIQALNEINISEPDTTNTRTFQTQNDIKQKTFLNIMSKNARAHDYYLVCV